MADYTTIKAIRIEERERKLYQIILFFEGDSIEMWHEPKPEGRVRTMLGVLTDRRDVPISFININGADSLLPDWVRAAFPATTAEPVQVAPPVWLQS